MGKVDDTFYGAVLTGIGAPTTPRTLALCHAWQACEGGSAHFNPWNTTHDDEGAEDYNTVGVKSYPSAKVGVHATVHTLNLSFYEHIRLALRTQDAEGFGKAVDASRWGTHHVEDYLRKNPPPPAGQHGHDQPPHPAAHLPVLKVGVGMPPEAPDGHVRTWQGLLHSHGLAVTVDGRFGSHTDHETRVLQSQQGLKVDGVVGEKTWAAGLRMK